MADPILTPRTQEELVGHVRAAARDRAPLFVTGGSARPPHAAPPALVISTRGLDRVIAHESGDLTFTAECGIGIGRAQEVLGGHRQFLAFDDPESTLGGAIARGRDGPMAARYGMVRDQVLGLTVVNGDGHVTHCGGRVVKNVTGYDLCRLYSGSRGGLGIILEATVRVRPLPERTRRFESVLDDEARAFDLAFEIRRRVPEAASIQIARGGAADRFVLSTVVSGLGAFVEAAGREIAAAAGGGASAADCDPLGAFAARAPGSGAVVAIAGPPAAWPALHPEVAALLSPATGWIHDVLRGVMTSWHAPDRPVFLDDRRLDSVLSKHGATLDCPCDPSFEATLASRFPGQVPGGLVLMRSLKSALDPFGILNPGLTVFG